MNRKKKLNYQIMKKTLIIAISFLLISCGSSIKTNFSEQLKPLTIEDKVAFLDLQNQVPDGAKKIGNAKFGDTGFSTNCDFNTNLISARKLARANGANIVKVTEKKEPSVLGSSCYRIKVDFYHFSGDVTKLPQYQLQIK